MRKACWRYANTAVAAPVPTNALAPTAAEATALNDHAESSETAAGIILNSLDPSQYFHVEGMMDDPHGMWTALKAVYQTQKANSRFYAMQALLAIHKENTESLSDFITRVNTAGSNLKALIATTLTVNDVIDEMCIHSAITGLGEGEYDSFTSSVLMIDNIDRAKVTEAFRNEDVKRSTITASSSALAAKATPTPKRGPGNGYFCTKCNKAGHSLERCFIEHPELKRGYRGTRGSGGKGKANADASANKAQDEVQPPATVKESACNASPRPPSSPIIDADTEWNTDTGATSHMTPHREWLRDYEPYRAPIRLATNEVVYSAGKGTVLFAPVIGGKPSQSVLFSRVLHVPALQNNLLAVLHLTSKHEFTVTIAKDHMLFTQRGDLLFTATVRNGSGYLNGTTIPNPEYALSVAKSPIITRSLLHQRLGHIGKDRLERLLKDNMVKGIQITDPTPIPDICEPCLAGKQHRAPFPHQSENRSTTPLQLVVSDLHGPMPTKTTSGYRYWITFTDDATRFTCVYLLKEKGQAFDAFLLFKAMAEKQLGKKLKRFRDDKGGEYIGSKWDTYFGKEGITHDRTTRATPQQNGISERKNQTLAEGVTAMLHESHLPPSMWGKAL